MAISLQNCDCQMASFSDPSPHSLSMSSSTSSLNQGDKLKDLSAKSNTTKPHQPPSSNDEDNEVDELIEKRIKKIYKRLKETDHNIKTMETLLGRNSNWKYRPYAPGKSQISHCNKQRAAPKQKSTSSLSSCDGFGEVHDGPNLKEIVRSLEDLQVTDRSKSSTSEQVRKIQRLTQSMQDLHNQQHAQNTEELHQKLPRKSKTKREKGKDTAMSAQIRESLRKLQQELPSSQNKPDLDHQITTFMQDLQEKISTLEMHHLKLDTTIEGLTKQMETRNCQSQSSFVRDNPNQNDLQEFQENMQHQLQEAIKISNEAAMQVKQVSAELQMLCHLTNRKTNANNIPRDKAKRVIHKLKTECETLQMEKKHFEETSHIIEEKCRSLAVEKELLLHQLDECRTKLETIFRDEQTAKARLVEEQIQNVKKESQLEYFKTITEETKRQLASCEAEVERLRSSNERCLRENEFLSQQNQELRNRATTQEQKLKESLQIPQEHENILRRLEDHRNQLHLLEIQKTDLSKKYMEEVETNKKLRDSLMDIKANMSIQMADAVKKKETEMNSVITLLKEQVGDYQAHNKLLQHESKNYSEENVRLSKEFMMMQSEIREMHSKQEGLLKNFYSKVEEVKLKNHKLEIREANMKELHDISRKMEQEYKTILATINAEVDHTIQLWNQSSTYTPQALSQVTGSTVHPKIHLVDITSKLKWMQDDLYLQLNSRKTNREISKPRDRHEVRDIQDVAPENSNTRIPKLNILSTLHSPEMTRKNNTKTDVSEDEKFYVGHPRANLQQSWNFSHIPKNPTEFLENLTAKNNKRSNAINKNKRLNSTEIGNENVQVNNRKMRNLKSNTRCDQDSTASPCQSSNSEPSRISDDDFEDHGATQASSS